MVSALSAAASFLQMPSWPPHASRRSRVWTCDPRDVRTLKSTSTVARRGVYLKDAADNEVISNYVRNEVMARSISGPSRMLSGLNSIPNDGATDWIAPNSTK
jgi:hypothetical protein